MPLSDFKLKSKLGKGTYGSVYKGVRKSDGKEYALKEVNIGSSTQSEREAAVNEIRVLASLRNPNVIQYYEAFVHHSSLFIVTEFARRGDLGRKIKRHRQRGEMIAESVIWSVLVQACNGLKSLHKRGILHRDLKPKNVFLSDGERVLIGDLGCSKLTKGQLTRTQVGTPYYIAPEIYQGMAYGEKADVWSLGCLVYELAMLAPPFSGHDMKSLSHQVRKAATPRLSSHYSRDLADVVKAMLSKDPAKRPTVAQLQAKPVVAAHASASGSAVAAAAAAGASAAVPGGSPAMLRTIHVPRSFRRLRANLALPEPRYPSGNGGGGGSSDETGVVGTHKAKLPGVPSESAGGAGKENRQRRASMGSRTDRKPAARRSSAAAAAAPAAAARRPSARKVSVPRQPSTVAARRPSRPSGAPRRPSAHRPRAGERATGAAAARQRARMMR